MTTEPIETSHTNTDDADVDNSGSLLGDEGTEDTQATEETTFTIPEEYEGNPLFEGIDSQEALFTAIASQGVPEEYTFPEGMSKEQAADITEQAKEFGMTQPQVDKMVEAETQQAKEYWADINKGVEGLRQEWGEDFDSKVKDANKAVKAFDVDGEVAKVLQENPKVGSNPAVIKLFNSIYAKIEVDKFIESEGGKDETPKDEYGNAYFDSYDKTMTQ